MFVVILPNMRVPYAVSHTIIQFRRQRYCFFLTYANKFAKKRKKLQFLWILVFFCQLKVAGIPGGPSCQGGIFKGRQVQIKGLYP